MYPFKENSFAVRNGWYVAAFASDLAEQPVARTILGLPVALYRKSDGTAVAVGGRCPHRNYPLGKSCVRGDAIVCGYHGIAFGPDGTCLDIPTQDAIPRAAHIPSYPLIEHGMWLWIWVGDPAKADPALLPDLAAIGYSGAGLQTAPLFTFAVKARYQLLNDNLLDLTHLAFLHGSNIGTLEHATTPEEITEEPGLIRSRRYVRGGQPTPYLKDRGFAGLIDQVLGMDFYAPGFHAGIGDTFYAADNPERAGERVQVGRVFHAVTPETAKSCHYFFGIGVPDLSNLDETRKLLGGVLREDIFAAEEVEQMVDLVGGSPSELLLKTDRTAVLGRRMLQRLMDAETGAP